MYTYLQQAPRSSLCLKALAVDDLGTIFVILLLGDPHLLKGGERGQDGVLNDNTFSILVTFSCLVTTVNSDFFWFAGFAHSASVTSWFFPATILFLTTSTSVTTFFEVATFGTTVRSIITLFSSTSDQITTHIDSW
jgi:hypothetical protein